MPHQFQRDSCIKDPNVQRAVETLCQLHEKQQPHSWIQKSRLLQNMMWRSNLVAGGFHIQDELNRVRGEIETLQVKHPQWVDAQLKEGERGFFGHLHVRLSVSVIYVQVVLIT